MFIPQNSYPADFLSHRRLPIHVQPASLQALVALLILGAPHPVVFQRRRSCKVPFLFGIQNGLEVLFSVRSIRASAAAQQQLNCVDAAMLCCSSQCGAAVLLCPLGVNISPRFPIDGG